jgi:HAD superfamily hydrolase (TIGR01484 family)
VKPLSALTRADVAPLHGVIFDLDDTVLSHGALTLAAYTALHDLARAGLRLVACTGRPAAWGEVVARQWPVALAVSENGAVAHRRNGAGLVRIDRLDVAAREERRGRLRAVVDALRAEFPELTLADDNLGRLTDVTFDVGETRQVPAEERSRLRAAAVALGAHTFESSIHVHVTLDGDDKASGVVRAIALATEEDSTAILARYAFVGDSGNDEACFSAFRLSFGVANVRAHSGRLSVVPRFVSEGKTGEGFAEIAARLLALRAHAPPS